MLNSMFGSNKNTGSSNAPIISQPKSSNNSDFGWIGRSVEIIGDVNFSDKLQVDGTIKGKLYSEKGTLIIGETGHLEAQIDVGTCIVHGSVSGNINARVKIEIHKSGKLIGDLTTPALAIEEGSVFNGSITMNSDAGKVLQHPTENVTSISEADKRKTKGA
ncbi:MAG: polymer-forming cytoskeletal protein [Acidobacteriota bacterium]